jgi:hypothetical protein
MCTDDRHDSLLQTYLTTFTIIYTLHHISWNMASISKFKVPWNVLHEYNSQFISKWYCSFLFSNTNPHYSSIKFIIEKIVSRCYDNVRKYIKVSCAVFNLGSIRKTLQNKYSTTMFHLFIYAISMLCANHGIQTKIGLWHWKSRWRSWKTE